MARERTPDQLREWIRTGHPWKSKDMEELYAKVPEVWTFDEPDEQYRVGAVAGMVLLHKVFGGVTIGNLLDVGCGKGASTAALADTLPDVLIDGIDISPTAIDYAKEHRARRNVTYGVADVRTYDFGGGKWDVMTPSEFFYFLEEDEAKRVAQAMVTGLRTPGLVVLSDHMRKRKWSVDLFASNGLKLVSDKRYSHDPEVLYAPNGEPPIPSKQSYRVVALGKGI